MRIVLAIFFFWLIPDCLKASVEDDDSSHQHLSQPLPAIKANSEGVDTNDLLKSEKMSQVKFSSLGKRDLTFQLSKNFLKTVQFSLGLAKAKDWKRRTSQSLAFLAVLRAVADQKNIGTWRKFLIPVGVLLV